MSTHLIMSGIDFRRRSNRRLACVATYVGFFLIVTAVSSGSLFVLASIPGGILCALGWWVLNEVARPYSGKFLDERQLQIRNHAFFRAYQVVASVTALGLIYVQFALDPRNHLFLPSGDREMQTIIWGFLLLSITLPHAFIAWRDPDYDA